MQFESILSSTPKPNKLSRKIFICCRGQKIACVAGDSLQGGHLTPTVDLSKSIREGGIVIEGGCLCGTVKYRIDGELQNARSCHCSRCRKAFSGAASAYAELVSAAAYSWVSGEDNVSRYHAAVDWGLGFCKTCGSTLCGYFKDSVHGVTLGCVDGDPKVEIAAHIFVGSKAPWDHIGGEAPQHAAQQL